MQTCVSRSCHNQCEMPGIALRRGGNIFAGQWVRGAAEASLGTQSWGLKIRPGLGSSPSGGTELVLVAAVLSRYFA